MVSQAVLVRSVSVALEECFAGLEGLGRGDGRDGVRQAEESLALLRSTIEEATEEARESILILQLHHESLVDIDDITPRSVEPA